MHARPPSPTVRYLASLERQARAAQPLPGWRINWGHALLGALSCPALYTWVNVRALTSGPPLWAVLPLASLLGGIAFALGGKLCWNALLSANRTQLLAQARSNLVDHELLLLCFEPELPAHYEKLRYAAQSHGKTRARNWAELRPGSMQDRVQWLVENYRVICAQQKLPVSTPALRRFNTLCTWLLLLPIVLLVTCIPAAVLHWLPQDAMVTALLRSIGLLWASMAVFTGLLQLANRVESSALLTVLVQELDLAVLEGAPEPPALN